MSKLDLDPQVVRKARSLAERAAEPVIEMARTHTTVSVERAQLRLAGLSGADADGLPWVNHLVDAVRDQVGLEHGVALPVWDALARDEAGDLFTLAQKAAVGSVSFRVPEGRAATIRAASRAALTSLPWATAVWMSTPVMRSVTSVPVKVSSCSSPGSPPSSV